VRELGSRVVPVWAALESLPNGRTQLVIVERISRRGFHGDPEIADWVRDARRLAMLEHPNHARIRDVATRAEDVLVVSDFVDGVRWSELVSSAQRPPLELALRVLVDVLAGLSAVHNLRDAKRTPLKLVHGELTPQSVLVGLDGATRIVGTLRIRTAAASPGAASPYLAPEILLADAAADARADVYSVGAMLWEALSGRALFASTLASAIATQILSGQVPLATVPAASPWAAPLVDAVARALSADPDKRFVSAAAFAAELRRIAGPRLAQPIRVAALVRATYGDSIRSRRESLERGDGLREEVSAVESRSEPVSVEVPIEVSFEPEERASTAPTPIPPAPTAPTRRPPQRALPAPQPPPRTRVATMRFAPPALERAGAFQVSAATTVSSLKQATIPLLKLPLPRAPGAGPPPLPEVALIVPAAPPVPKDLVASMNREPAGPVPVATPPSPPPSTPPLATSRESLAEMQRTPRRVVALALVVGPSVVVATALVWWLSSRVTRHAPAPAPYSAQPAPSATQPQPPLVVVEPPVQISPPAPTSLENATPTTPDTSATAASQDSSSPTLAPAPVVHPPIAKPKYDPQGI
jgi:eukaryotic-like serine/threonine-protein kinase